MEAILGKANCIVLTPEPEQIDDELQRLLQAWNWQVRQTNVPVLAMADLCLLERTQSSRSAWGLPQCEGIALIVVDPDSWPDLQSMLTAITRYVPIVSIWSFDEENLQCVSEPETNKQENDETKQIPNPQIDPANWSSLTVKDNDDESEDETTDSHLSGDELAMLLDIEEPDQES